MAEARASAMLAYEDLFLQVYVLIDDLLLEGRVVIPG